MIQSLRIIAELRTALYAEERYSRRAAIAAAILLITNIVTLVLLCTK